MFQTANYRRRHSFRQQNPKHVCTHCHSLVYEADIQCADCLTVRSSVWLPLEHSKDLLLGRIVDDRYLLTKRLGESNGMVTYRATALNAPLEFALKFIDITISGLTRDGLEAEVETLASLTSPLFNRVHGILNLYEDYVVVVFDYVEAESLEEITQGKAFDVMRATRITRELAEGLEEAHRLGLIHGDLTLDKVLVLPTPSGRDRIRVCDLGLFDRGVKPLNGATRAPEHDRLAPTIAMDIFSLGVLFRRMLDGQLTPSTDAYRSINRRDLGLPRGTCNECDILVRRMMSTHPGDRPTNALTVVGHLERIERGNTSQPLTLEDAGSIFEIDIPETPSERWHTNPHGQFVQMHPIEPEAFQSQLSLEGRIRVAYGTQESIWAADDQLMIARFSGNSNQKIQGEYGITAISGAQECGIVGDSDGCVSRITADRTDVIFCDVADGAVTSVHCGPHGYALAGTAGGRVFFGHINDRYSWSCILEGSPATGVSITEDNSFSAIATRDTVHVYRTQKWREPVVTLAVRDCERLAMSQNGHLIATQEGGMIRVYQVLTGRCILETGAPHGLVSLAFDSTGVLTSLVIRDGVLSGYLLNEVHVRRTQ